VDADRTKNLVLEAASRSDGKKTLSCAQAFRIHREHGVALKDIGRMCNENGIRICACQLGCFK